MLAAFLALITCAIASHWAVWRRLGECEAKCGKLTTRVESQAKQLAGLQTWANRVIRRDDEQGPPRPADPETYLARTYPKGPNEL